MAARPRRRAGLVVALVLLAALLVTGPAAPADPGTAGAEPAARADVPPGHDELGRAIDRFYRGFFLRRPDDGGFTQWYCLASKGRVDLATIAQSFVDSAEFAARYGRLDHPAFVDLAYRNVFARPPEPSGRAYWLGQLDGGLPPGWMMVHLTESSEFRARTAAARPPVVDPAVLAAETCGPTLLTWISRGLPAGFATAVAGHPAVSQHTTVHGDLIELVSTRDAGGGAVDTAPGGWAYPIDALAIDPASYAAFWSGRDRDVLAGLAPGGVILTESSARVRRLGIGGTLAFRGGAVTVAGIVSDRAGGAAEVLLHRADAARLGVHRERFMLLRDTDRVAIERHIRASTPRGTYVSVRGSSDTRYLRQADRVDPQAHVKLAFGEFAFRDSGGRTVQVDAAWTAANIRTERVPLLGRITCHRAILPKVRAALQRVADAGLGGTVDPSRYAGCWYARRIEPGQGLSRHSWGIALDVNIGADPRGDYGTQHPFLVASMRDVGFHWGGDWEYPDPGHYEARSGL